MSTSELLITNATLVTTSGLLAADVLIRGQQIVEVRQRSVGADSAPPAHNPAQPRFDATGLWLLPGGVDAHVHFGMPLADGIMSLGWRESSAAALLGGTTTVIDFANPEPGESINSAVDRWRTAADGQCLCDFGLHATVTSTSDRHLAELQGLIERGIPTFKAFLAYKDRLMLSRDQLECLMNSTVECGGRLLVHAEDGEHNSRAEQALLAAGRTGPEWHPAAHPPQSEIAAVATSLDCALATGCPLYLVHLSLAESVRHVRTVRQQIGDTTGDQVSAEVCLHHLFASTGCCHNDPDDFLRATLSPPLREVGDSRNLLAYLADGTIDVLATDHCEFSLAVKTALAAGGFPAIPNGTGGVGERMVFAYTLAVATGDLDHSRWITVACQRPAQLMGLAGRKGKIAPGYDADLVAFDPTAEYRWQPPAGSDPSVSLYTDRQCRGRVVHVWLRGNQVVCDGTLTAAAGSGTFLKRNY